MTVSFEVTESVPTPEDLAMTMKNISEYSDTEDRHIMADNAMRDVLRVLGYEEAMEIFDEMVKWYA